MENSSGAKAVIGSGFFVTADGHIITNYHVISKQVHYPERYRTEFVDASGASNPVSIIKIDVINDLAIVQAKIKPAHYFKLAPVNIKQGVRLFSLGFPHDIGLTIVEGTYNGFLKYALYKKIHFTGSINPGMSGGPTITAFGNVVGVNVSSAGEQVSFLVPVDAVLKLLSSALKQPITDSKKLLEAVRSQLLLYQDSYISENIINMNDSVQLGRFRLPSKLASYFNCWADANRKEKDLFHTVNHQCSTDDYIYVSSSHRSGVIRFRHRLITTDKLNRFRFYSLYSNLFNEVYVSIHGSEEEVTKYKCETKTVDVKNISFKTTFCVRRYRKLEGLYDAIFKAASLGENNSGLETTLVLSSVSFENAVKVSKRYLEAISWKE
ncbi:MAG: serine protease [Nitrospirota bacterium]